MSVGAFPVFALAPPPRRLLSARRAWLAGCVLAAGAVALGLAPDRIEHADILVSGGAAPQALAALESTLGAADAALAIAPTPRGLTVSRRRAAALPLLPVPPTLHALAATAIAAIAAAPPQGAAPPGNAEDRPLLAAERDDAEAALTRDEAELARLSGALTDLARDQARLLQQDGTPTPDPDNAPTRKLLADLEARRIDLAARYTADFPGIAITDQEIAQLRALIATPARAGAAAAQAAHTGALGVLRAEQARVAGEYTLAATHRADSLRRIGDLEQGLAAEPALPSAPLSMVVIDLPAGTQPDQRPLPLAAIAALALAGSLLPRPRRRPNAFAALEQATGLPIITCLDTTGQRLPMPPPALQAPRHKSLFVSFSSEKENSF